MTKKMSWVEFNGISTDKALDIYQIITGCSDRERELKAEELATVVCEKHPKSSMDSKAAVSVQTALNMVLLELKKRRVARPKAYDKWVI